MLVSLFLLAVFRDFPLNDDAAAGTISNFNSVAEMGGKCFQLFRGENAYKLL